MKNALDTKRRPDWILLHLVARNVTIKRKRIRIRLGATENFTKTSKEVACCFPFFLHTFDPTPSLIGPTIHQTIAKSPKFLRTIRNQKLDHVINHLAFDSVRLVENRSERLEKSTLGVLKKEGSYFYFSKVFGVK